ncbi:MAG TPA: Rrf2 family transcriptional regulator [Bryobacteraceae bacterium]|nr:Rrf2 family transcriptional regulator [Bryobacteraceae bacterium]
MQLTRAADYAVRVMVHLAAAAPGTRVSRTELAGVVDCPEQFLSKVLQSLTRAGLVTSHRGNTGGFELPAARRSSSVLDIVEAVEGPIRLNICLNSPSECVHQATCPTYPVWEQAQKAMTAVLRGATIDTMAQHLPNGGAMETVQVDEISKN